MDESLLKYKQKETVALIGFASATREMVPWDNKEMDFWSMNERYNHGHLKMDKITGWIQIHSYLNVTRAGNLNDANHPDWLRKEHSFPIFMQRHYPDFPSSVRYPIEEAIAWVGRKYLNSGVAYMLVLACLMGYKRIELYGFDMGSESEYRNQRPNFEYLMGLARGRGVEIYIPYQSHLAEDCMYAYQHSMIPFRQHAEFRERTLQGNMKTAENDFYIAKGKYQAYKEILAGKIAVTDEIVMQMQEKAHLAGGVVNVTSGAEQELNYIISSYDHYFLPLDADWEDTNVMSETIDPPALKAQLKNLKNNPYLVVPDESEKKDGTTKEKSIT